MKVQVLGNLLAYVGYVAVAITYAIWAYFMIATWHADEYWLIVQILGPLNVWWWISAVIIWIPSIVMVRLGRRIKGGRKQLD